MLILVIFSFFAGVVTILSPCILPILPIILSGSVGTDTSDRSRPYGIVTGFVLSFTFFTLFLSSLVKILGIPSDLLRTFAVSVLFVFGLTLTVPKLAIYFELLFSKFAAKAPRAGTKKGFLGGVILGLTLGLLWAPCVGPILASVITLALIGDVTLNSVVITAAYAIGTAIPMFFIIVGGKKAVAKIPVLTNNLPIIQKVFGIIMILTAVAIAANFDRKVQTAILDAFPSYGTGLTKLEELDIVTTNLTNITPDSTKPNTNDGGNSATVDSGDFSATGKLANKGVAPELITGGEWINSDPLTLEGLKGKVVLIDFWTYSCINCQRTLPYLRDWWSKYNADGFVIIGVHSPEFEFEKEYDNVARAVRDFELAYPVMQDNEFKTWRAYNNRYWPAKYLVDKDGNIRYTHFGEGEYDETEEAIQMLLKETGSSITQDINNPSYKNFSKTPETYLGYGRIAGFVSPESIVKENLATYTAPKNIPRNGVAYEGEWYIAEEYANPQTNSSLLLNFDAKNVFLVMNPKTKESVVNVYLDEQFVKQVTVTADDLYTLIELQTPEQHILKLEFLDKNTEVYAFTFG